MNVADTIFAVSSPPGRSQRAVLRVCGPEACKILGLEEAQRSCSIGRVFIGEEALPTLLLVSRSPQSYSGEDMVEMLVPGGQALLNRLEETLYERAGSLSGRLRSAEPGEFSARAYLNGRIDLLQAEGIAEAIRAQTDSQLRASSFLRDGELSGFVAALTERLTEFAGLVEAGIDFTDEEDVVAISNEALATGVGELIDELQARLDQAVPIERLETVPMVVLAGRPNAGKSTLFNALLERDRTVVTRVEGTTRDVILEPLLLEAGELEILLADLAGFDPETDDSDAIGLAMQRQAQGALGRADLVVRCTPIGELPVELATDAPILDVVTKSDLAQENRSPAPVIVSVHKDEGLDQLKRAIASALGGMQNSLSAGVMVLTRRHQAMLRRVLDALEQTDELLKGNDAPAELLAATLRDALDALGELVGRVTPDDVLDHVFARFCVGK